MKKYFLLFAKPVPRVESTPFSRIKVKKNMYA